MVELFVDRKRGKADRIANAMITKRVDKSTNDEGESRYSQYSFKHTSSFLSLQQLSLKLNGEMSKWGIF